ncbi:FAD-binding protein [Pseudomaricurvus alcaniphilus]|uniref:FAD-dependent monooxygenase n=1 Tax=Pseudomaricurvus alcaniphilus TaxID=1166482 RepID=UPI001407F43E|nr:FAD-dependent monooxygenase [Pseudomaricurvus alcaniphilus]NHN39976.1 FAD-binding protein [Pseudomaricurvus alcaniphilus]
MSEKVLVIGGGIAGFSTAIGLHQRGIDVEIVELHKQWQVYHVGIIVQSNFIRALAQLGVGDKAVQAGYPYKGWRFLKNDDGKELARDEGVSSIGEEYPADLGLARPALHDVLFNKVSELNIPLRQGVTFTSFKQTNDHVVVEFTDGTQGTYDIVVAADGAYSKVREELFAGKYKPEFFGQGVWRYNLKRPKDLEWAEGYITDPTRSIGTVPLTEEEMYIFVCCCEPGNPYFPPETLAEEMRKRLTGYGPIIDSFAEQITDPSLVVYRPLEVCIVPKPWYKGRVVLIGDAAHSATPHLGQGAAMAVEDAVVLAEELDSPASMEQRLERFMERRFDRAKYIATQSMQLGQWMIDLDSNANPIGVYQEVRKKIAEPI